MRVIYCSNISEGTALLLQGLTKNDAKGERYKFKIGAWNKLFTVRFRFCLFFVPNAVILASSLKHELLTIKYDLPFFYMSIVSLLKCIFRNHWANLATHWLFRVAQPWNNNCWIIHISLRAKIKRKVLKFVFRSGKHKFHWSTSTSC